VGARPVVRAEVGAGDQRRHLYINGYGSTENEPGQQFTAPPAGEI
jgi:hypothetical protein